MILLWPHGRQQPPAILFYRFSLGLFFAAYKLISEIAWPIVTKLCHISLVTQIYKIRSEIWVAPSPPPPRPKFGGPKTSKFRRDFGQLRDLDSEYLRNATEYRQSKNGIANYGHSRIGKLNSVSFAPQTAKNRTGVLTHPTGDYQAGHCHASM